MATMSPSGLLSPSSTSSYDYLSAHSGPHTQSESFGVLSDAVSLSSDDGDDIVWSLSDLSLSSASYPRRPPPRGPGSRSPAAFSDEDFIVLSRPRTPARMASATRASLEAAFTSLSLSSTDAAQHARRHSTTSSTSSASPPSSASSPKKRAKKAKAAPSPAKPKAKKAAQPKPAAGPPTSPEVTESLKAAKAALRRSRAAKKSPPASPPKPANNASTTPPAKKASPRRAIAPAPAVPKPEAAGLGDRAIVDDVSEAGDSGFAYHDAVEYISSFLEAPSPQAQSNLTLLQALIVELGLSSAPSLPSSLRAARALLKSSVFLNIRDYLAVRGEGLDALRRVMHPSRVSLMREVRAGKRAPLRWVKASGLNVLLVTCY